MAIAPLQLPGTQPFVGDLGLAQSLGQLGKVYEEGQLKRGMQEALANGSLNPNDPQSLSALAAKVLPYNQGMGMSLAQLATAAANTQYQHGRDASNDAWRQQESARTQQNADRSHQLQVRSADRADDPTPAGFIKGADGNLKPIPGGPADPSYLGQRTAATIKPEIPSGFRQDATGGLVPIPGGPADPAYLRQKGDRQNAPSGYQWNDPNDPSKGMTAIPGGPGEKVDAEVAGRLGLAKSFLGQLPDIKKRIAAGEVTGPLDAAAAKAGLGGAGEVRRQIDSGAEALLRMLTGAGMNKEEAAEYTRRYKVSPFDTSANLLSKMDQLERELNSVGETVGKGRGGWVPPNNAQSQPAKQAEPAKQDAQGFRAAPKVGELRDGYRYKGGNPGDPTNWVKQQESAFNSRFDAAFDGGR